ncbi:glycosyltransferase [Ravibacter arvi]|uniref:Glycosyltransferase n=1 Tax=Ravibacter arvi TaxID=2051041 RepID=A0ABP8LNM4_9BACT
MEASLIFVEIFFWLLAAGYAVFTLWLWRTWSRIRVFQPAGTMNGAGTETLISVIVPVRNEAVRIGALLADLERQSLGKQLYEIWIADDASTDATAALVRAFAEKTSMRLHLLELSDNRSASPKKRAISSALQKATGKYVVTTDGDCRVGPAWLETLVACFRESGARCVSGPVTFTPESKLTDHLQTVEFSSLVGSGACAIAAGRPNMCNGANFAYEKSVFFEVGGFEGVDQIASGDDELLLQKIAQRYPEGIVFLKSPEAIVRTAPHTDWKGFRNQRQRWASKWKFYRSPAPKVLAVFIFLSNLMLLVAGLWYAFGQLSGYTWLALIGFKILPEWLFISSVLRFLGKQRSIACIPLVQVLYPFYVVYFGLAGQKSRYVWKGRELR